jgi:hypothetical protein
VEEEPSFETMFDELPEEVIDEILEGEEFIVEEDNEGSDIYTEEDLSDWDVTLLDGLEDEPWVEEVEEPSIEEVKNPGLMDTMQKPERRRVQRVKNVISIENNAKLKKGPLWDFRTNKREDDDQIFE